MTDALICEAGRLDYFDHDPVIVKCGKPATKLVGGTYLQTPVCDECYERLPEKYKSWRVEDID